MAHPKTRKDPVYFNSHTPVVVPLKVITQNQDGVEPASSRSDIRQDFDASLKKNKSKHHQFLDTIEACFNQAIAHGIFHLNTEDEQYDGRYITLNKQRVLNFGSCSYLGLEVDDRLKQGAIWATTRFGTQFSCSRAYMSCGLYQTLEQLLARIFDAPVVVAPSTSLAHMATVPVVVNDEDAVILDHQVHASVQNAVQLTRPRGVSVDMIRHNHMQMLEDQIKSLRHKHRQIWYMADGVYSMYGDYAPFLELQTLLDKYEQFRLYIDDAHGMSWAGPRGCGTVLQHMPLHPHMVLVTSLAKGFGTGGGVIVALDQALIQRIRTCGSTLIFSGPIQPPMLGASIASAQLHLSDEMPHLQQSLHTLIDTCHKKMKQHGIPLVTETHTPLFYVGIGLLRVAYNVIQRLLKDGFYVNIGTFPGVPIKCAGIRFTLQRYKTKQDIRQLADAMAYHIPRAFEEEGCTYHDIEESFHIPVSLPVYSKCRKVNKQLRVEIFTSIEQVPQCEWDLLFAHRGTFDAQGLRLLEAAFKGQEKPENNWQFYYYLVRDESHHIVAASFFTLLLSKDDMIAPDTVSFKIEEKRKKDPYYLTSRVMMMGSLLTEGEHLYVDRQHPDWKSALLLLLEQATLQGKKEDASMVQLRDFEDTDDELSQFLQAQGFVKIKMPDTHVLSYSSFEDLPSYLVHLHRDKRWHIKRHMLRYQSCYDVRVVDKPSLEQLQWYYHLYLNVKRKSVTINTFDLPFSVFEQISQDKQWEVLELSLTCEHDSRPVSLHKPVAVVFCYIGPCHYSPMVIGLDYDMLKEFECYRQALFQLVMRGMILGKHYNYLGFGASSEKQMLGAQAQGRVTYLQARDNYQLEVLELVSKDKTM